MCGFCLVIDDTAVDIRHLTESIRHRGPDSTQYYLGPRVRCGFNRLAIVDDDPRSDQPMLDPSGRYLLAFNGEIYNHDGLRAELAQAHGIRFATRSDTEVLLQGLIHDGAGFTSRLDGIFAFAFVDLHAGEALLARDVFGVKPLYYFTRADRLYVSSEIRPLWQLTGNAFSLPNIARYLAYGTVGSGEAIVCGIRELEPNAVKRFRRGRIEHVARIQDFEYGRRDGARPGETGEVLFRAIDSQRPTIPYGVLFSGGVDSTLILERCARDSNLVGAYSVDVAHPDMSERHWQELAVRTLGVEGKYRRIELRPEHLSVDSIARISRGLDYPLFHPNFIGSWLLTRLAAEDGLKVLLSGEGADELFLGYRWFYSEQSPSEFLEYVPLSAIQAVLGCETRPICTEGMSLLEVFQKIYLQRWLLRQDMTGMANSVEVRVPFLGAPVAEFANSLSNAFKKGTGESKWMLKELLAARFPREFMNRRKVGFDFPLNDWIGEDHVSFLRDRPGLIDNAALTAVLGKYLGSHMRNRNIFSLVALVAWHEAVRSGAWD